MKKLILSVCILFVFSLRAIAANVFYVSTTGTTTGAGTIASPLKLETAFDYCAPGDSIILMNGTYTRTSPIYLYGKGGATGGVVYIKAQNRHQAILVGSGTLISADYGVLFIDGFCKNIVVDGLVFTRPSGSTDQGPGVSISEGSEFITIRNCIAYGNGASGITAQSADHIIFEDNIAHDNASRNAFNGSGISMYKAKTNTVNSDYWSNIIRRNISYHNYCDIPFTFGSETSPTPTDGNGIIIDFFDNPGGTAYQGRTLVENNLCFDNGGKGIQIFKSSKVRCINNTVYHNNWILDKYVNINDANSVTAEIGLYEPLGVGGIYNEGIYNNVAVANPALKRDYAMVVEDGINQIYNNFLIGIGAKTTFYSNSIPNFPSANTVKVISDQASAKFINATTNFATANFRVQPSSPFVGGYTQTYQPLDDLDKVSRPQGTYSDLGAYEFVYVTSVSVSPATASIQTGSTRQLSSTALPVGSTYKNVSWSSSNTGIATVSTTGLVTAVAAGTATITATTIDGNKTAVCTVTVTATALPQSCGLILNYGFETGNFSNWSNADGASAVSNSSKSGAKAAVVNGLGGLVYSTQITVTPGYKLNFSVQAKIESSPTGPQVGLDYYNSAGTKIGSDVLNINTTVYSGYSLSKVPTPGTVKVQVWTKKTSTTGKLYIDDFCLTESNTCYLLTNYGFEDGLTGWTNTSSVASVGTATQSKSGNKSAIVNGTSRFARSSNIAVTTGNKVNFEFWAKIETNPTSPQIGIDYLNAAGTRIGGKTFTINTTAYTSYSSSEVPTSGTTQVLIWAKKSSTTGKIYMDDFCLSTVSAAREAFEETSPEEFAKIFPNPTSDILRVPILDNSERNMEVELMDMTGRSVINKSFETHENQSFVEVVVSGLQTGTYLVKAKQGIKQNVQKMIKE